MQRRCLRIVMREFKTYNCQHILKDVVTEIAVKHATKLMPSNEVHD